jgi:hypothetical protein
MMWLPKISTVLKIIKIIDENNLPLTVTEAGGGS